MTPNFGDRWLQTREEGFREARLFGVCDQGSRGDFCRGNGGVLGTRAGTV